MRPQVATDKKEELKIGLIETLRFGHENAQTGRSLAEWLDTTSDDRRIRLVIRGLIKDGYPIASSTERPVGYFMTATQEDAKKYIQDLKNRIIEDCRRLRDYKIAARPILFPGQLPLMLKEVKWKEQ